MPIAMDPKARVEFSLAYDERNVAEADRVVFSARFLTAAESIEARGLVAAALADKTTEAEALEGIFKVWALCGVQWRNLKDRKGRAVKSGDYKALPAVLSEREIWELVNEARRRPGLTEDDIKKSVSPSASATAASADPAEKQDKTADASGPPE